VNRVALRLLLSLPPYTRLEAAPTNNVDRSWSFSCISHPLSFGSRRFWGKHEFLGWEARSLKTRPAVLESQTSLKCCCRIWFPASTRRCWRIYVRWISSLRGSLDGFSDFVIFISDYRIEVFQRMRSGGDNSIFAECRFVSSSTLEYIWIKLHSDL